MRAGNSLGVAALLLSDRLLNSRSDAESSLVRRAFDVVNYLSNTGQLYPFEDFRKATTAGRIQSVAFAEVIHFLERLASQSASADERDTLRAAVSALAFIDATGQHGALDEHLSYKRLKTLPPVVAAFKSEDEAESWLRAQPFLMKGARLLIRDEYHYVFPDPVGPGLYFLRSPLVAEFIERKLEEGLPLPVTAAFDTREQAETWLTSTTEPLRHAFITIGGEYHLAVFWNSVKHRALYPFTIVAEMQREKRELSKRLARIEESERAWEQEGDAGESDGEDEDGPTSQ